MTETAPLIDEEAEKEDYSSPTFMLRNLALFTDCQVDTSFCLQTRQQVAETIATQICFYCYCGLKALGKKMTLPSILFFGAGCIGAITIQKLIDNGCKSFLNVFCRGDESAREWRGKGIRSSNYLARLIKNEKPDIIIMCSGLSSFPAIRRQLVTLTSPSSLFITSTLGLQRRRIFGALKISTVFRTFQEPSFYTRQARQSAAQDAVYKATGTFDPDRLLRTVANNPGATLGSKPGTAQGLPRIDAGNNNNNNGVTSVTPRPVELDDNDPKKQMILRSDKTLDLFEMDDLGDIEASANVIAKRSGDIRHLIYVLENYYSLHGMLYPKARGEALRSILGYNDTDLQSEGGEGASGGGGSVLGGSVRGGGSVLSSHHEEEEEVHQASEAVADREPITMPTTPSIAGSDGHKQNHQLDLPAHEADVLSVGSRDAGGGADGNASVASVNNFSILSDLFRGNPDVGNAVDKLHNNVAIRFQNQFSKHIRVVDLPKVSSVSRKGRQPGDDSVGGPGLPPHPTPTFHHHHHTHHNNNTTGNDHAGESAAGGFVDDDMQHLTGGDDTNINNHNTSKHPHLHKHGHHHHHKDQQAEHDQQQAQEQEQEQQLAPKAITIADQLAQERSKQADLTAAAVERGHAMAHVGHGHHGAHGNHNNHNPLNYAIQPMHSHKTLTRIYDQDRRYTGFTGPGFELMREFDAIRDEDNDDESVMSAMDEVLNFDVRNAAASVNDEELTDGEDDDNNNNNNGRPSSMKIKKPSVKFSASFNNRR